MKSRVAFGAIVFLVLSSAAVLAAQDKEIPKAKQTTLGLYLSAREAYDMWRSDPDKVVFIDNRTPEEYVFVGHPPMARNIPAWFVKEAWDSTTKKPSFRENPAFLRLVSESAEADSPIILMCRSGGRSAQSANALAEAGFTNVYSLIEGFEGDMVKDPESSMVGKRALNGWKNAGLPWTYELDPTLVYSAQSAETSNVHATPGDGFTPGQVRSFGTLREALREGHTEGRVNVKSLGRKGVYGVGAMEGLQGEITISDGELWITTVDQGRLITTHSPSTSAAATLLFASEVSHWETIEIGNDVSPSEFDEFIADQAKTHNFVSTSPFVFVIEGPLSHVKLHVIAGECPERSRMLGQELTTKPFEASFEKIDGILIGVFAVDSTGQITHGDSKTHVHAIIKNESSFTGHVESVGVRAGAILKIPSSKNSSKDPHAKG